MMDGPESVNYQSKANHSCNPGKYRGLEKSCDGRSGNPQQKTEKDGDGYGKIKDGIVVRVRPVLFLNQGVGETAVDKGLGNRKKDAQHRDDAVVLRKENPSDQDIEHELDTLAGKAIEGIPEYAVNGLLF